jgi:hypothetical protein
MKDTRGEKVVASFGSLTLTNKRITQERSGYWSGDTQEIPLHKLDSIGHVYKRNLLLFIIGILVTLFGILPAGKFFLIIGIVLLILGLRKHEVLELRAGTLKLHETYKGSKQFVNAVRSELRKNNYV